MSVAQRFYNMAYFQEIAAKKAFVQLPQMVLDTLKELEASLDIPSATEQNATHASAHAPNHGHAGHSRPNRDDQFKHRDSNRSSGSARKPTKQAPKTTEEEWTAMRSFKPTKLGSPQVGVDKYINEIRTLINKLSNTNYDKQRGIIVENIREYLASDFANDENTQKMVNSVFDIVSVNKMHCAMYAELYGECMRESPVFERSLHQYVELLSAMSIPAYVDADTDYDAYCAYNKIMDKRKNSVLFVASAMKCELVPVETVFRTLATFLTETHKLILVDGNEKTVDEMLEIVFLIVSHGSLLLAKQPDWQVVAVDRIRDIAAMKAKMHPSISNRAIFKCKDMLDILAAV
jgi:hypothetical protein